MSQLLLQEIEKGSKSAQTKKRIITHYIYSGSSTLTDLSKELDLSVPTVTKFVMEMCDEGYIIDYGKLETSGGRHPNLYGLNPESGYFVGVDIKKFAINIGMINFKGDMMEKKLNIPYQFDNTPGLEGGYMLKKDNVLPELKLLAKDQSILLDEYEYILSKNDFERKKDYRKFKK